MRQQQYQQQLLYQQQQMQQQQPLVPQPTAYGSNNPFSAFAPPAATPPVPAPQPQLQPQATYTPPPQASPARQSAQPRLPKDDGKNAELARLLAAGGGLDTFGNIGSTRMPAYVTPSLHRANVCLDNSLSALAPSTRRPPAHGPTRSDSRIRSARPSRSLQASSSRLRRYVFPLVRHT